MKPIHIVFIIAFGIAGAVSMFELSKTPPIQHLTEVFQTYTNTSALPKSYKLHHVNEDIIPRLRWRMFWGLLGGLVYGFLMMNYLRWAIKKGAARKQTSEEPTTK